MTFGIGLSKPKTETIVGGIVENVTQIHKIPNILKLSAPFVKTLQKAASFTLAYPTSNMGK